MHISIVTVDKGSQEIPPYWLFCFPLVRSNFTATEITFHIFRNLMWSLHCIFQLKKPQISDVSAPQFLDSALC